MILVSHPTGNANVRALLLGLENAGLLAGFRTSIDAGAGPRLVRCLPKGLRDELERRTFPIPSHKIGSRDRLGIRRRYIPQQRQECGSLLGRPERG